MPKFPSFQFYPGDWMKDPKLGLCSPATRGIWIDCLCAMHESDPRGIIEGSADQLARLLRASSSDVQSAVDELLATGAATVTLRNGKITLTNRRMVKEANERESNRLRQDRHRKKRNSNGKVTLHSSSSSSSSSSKTKTKKDCGPHTRAAKSTWMTPFEKVWKEILDGAVFNFGKAAGPLKELADEHGTEKVCKHLRKYLEAKNNDRDRDFISIARFAETFGTWGDKRFPAIPGRRHPPAGYGVTPRGNPTAKRTVPAGDGPGIPAVEDEIEKLLAPGDSGVGGRSGGNAKGSGMVPDPVANKSDFGK